MTYYKGAAYPIGLNDTGDVGAAISSLVDICCNNIVKDSTTTEKAARAVPHELCASLMKAALRLNQDRAISVLVTNWPVSTFCLKSLAPKLLTSVKALYDTDYLTEKMKIGMKYTTSLAYAFLEEIKKRGPTKLRYLDLSGYPAAEAIVHTLATNCLQLQDSSDAMITSQDHLPESYLQQNSHVQQNYIIKLDVYVQRMNTGTILCKALQLSNKPYAKLRLRVSQFDLSCLGEQTVKGMVNATYAPDVSGLCLKYNAFSDMGVIQVAPDIQLFRNLTALDLSCNGMLLTYNSTACETLSKLFTNLPVLRRLDISNNHIKGKLRSLLSGLTSGLYYLKVAGCQMIEADIGYLATSHHATSLSMLDISENNLRHFCSTVVNLLRAIANNIEILEMENCGCFEEHFVAFSKCCAMLNRLRYWNIQSPYTPPNMADNPFWRSIAKMPLLDTIWVSHPEDYLANATEEELPDMDQFFCSYTTSMVRMLLLTREAFYGHDIPPVNAIIGEYNSPVVE